MNIPESLILTEGFYLTDGGTTVLIGETAAGDQCNITLAQHLLPVSYDPNLLPGRLYFNKALVPIRSEAESHIIALLQTAEIAGDPQPPPGPETAPFDGPGMIIGEDLKQYYDKLSQGKRAVIEHLVKTLVAAVKSPEYEQNAQTPRK